MCPKFCTNPVLKCIKCPIFTNFSNFLKLCLPCCQKLFVLFQQVADSLKKISFVGTLSTGNIIYCFEDTIIIPCVLVFASMPLPCWIRKSKKKIYRFHSKIKCWCYTRTNMAISFANMGIDFLLKKANFGKSRFFRPRCFLKAFSPVVFVLF